jgi:hypothetical protein
MALANLCSLAPGLAAAEATPNGLWARVVVVSFSVNCSAPPRRGFPGGFGPRGQDSYLVDSASSHMLVSKIKPCMSKYKQYIP